MRRTIREAPCRSSRAPSRPTKIGPSAAFADDQIDRSGGAGRERDGDVLAALAQDQQGAVTAFQAESFDVGTDRFRHPQPVQRQQRDQGVIASAGEPGRDQHRADLVAVQAGGVGLVVEPRSTHMHRRRAIEQTFFDRVPVQAR